MARGITSFTDYIKKHTPGGTMYHCPFCSFNIRRQRGNALPAHNKAVAAIKKHVEERHQPTTEAKP